MRRFLSRAGLVALTGILMKLTVHLYGGDPILDYLIDVIMLLTIERVYETGVEEHPNGNPR